MAKRDVDFSVLDSACGMAGELAKAGDDLAAALESGLFTEALDYNLRLWQAITTVVDRAPKHGSLRDELTRAASVVRATTLAMGRVFSTEAVVHLVRLDLDVARGLFEGIVAKLLAGDAGRKGGAPDFNDTGFWPAVERGMKGLASH